MGKKTDIAWADSTLNLEMGCDGCELWVPGHRTCYAGLFTDKAGGHGAKGWPRRFEEPAIFADRIQYASSWSDLRGKPRHVKPWILSKFPRLVFLNDMGDTFTEALPVDWLLDFIPQLVASPHIYLILTKRVNRMIYFFHEVLQGVPDNFWLGVSVTDQATAHGRLRDFAQLRAGVKFVSYEPMLGPVDFNAVLESVRLSWVIFGGESGQDYQPFAMSDLSAAVRACQAHRVAVFVKQDAGVRPGRQGRIPDSLFIREFPDVVYELPVPVPAEPGPKQLGLFPDEEGGV